MGSPCFQNPQLGAISMPASYLEGMTEESIFFHFFLYLTINLSTWSVRDITGTDFYGQMRGKKRNLFWKQMHKVSLVDEEEWLFRKEPNPNCSVWWRMKYQEILNEKCFSQDVRIESWWDLLARQ